MSPRYAHHTELRPTSSMLLRSFLLFVVLAPTAVAADPPVDYARDVKPVLQARCYACHGALKQKSKLRLDSGEFIRKGGSRGPAIVPGQSAGSLLIARVTDVDEASRMP